MLEPHKNFSTGADSRAQSLSFLQQRFGNSAAWYLGVANGEDDPKNTSSEAADSGIRFHRRNWSGWLPA